MKKVVYLLLMGLLVLHCKPIQQTEKAQKSSVVFENDSIAYAIIVTDLGYDNYLATIAKPKNYYSQSYYELKNRQYVLLYNEQVRFGTSGRLNQVFEQEIAYDPKIDYGLEVNYKLFNYFKFIEYTYRLNLFN